MNVLDLLRRTSRPNNGVGSGSGGDGSTRRPDGQAWWSDTSPRNPDDGVQVGTTSGDADYANNSYNAIYEQLLEFLTHRDNPFQAFAGNGDNQVKALLNYLALNQEDLDFKHGAQQDLLKWIQTLNQRDYEQTIRDEQRDYNKSVLDEQRQYDSPTAQLQRLMATGLSRSAALELLNGSGLGGSSSGSSLVQSPITPSGASFAADYNQAGGTTLRNYVGAATDIANALANLASTALSGIPLGNTLKTGALLGQQLFSGQMQQSALQSVGSLMGAIYSTAADGTPFIRPKDGEVRNAEGLLNWMQGVSKDDNPNVYDYVRSPQFKEFANNPFAWQLYDTLYGEHSNASQVQTEYDYMTQSELLQLQKHAASVDLRRASTELDRLLVENSMFKDLAPFLREKQLIQVQDDIDMLMAARTPEQLNFRIQQIKDSNQSLAYIAMIDRLNYGNFWESVKDSNLKQTLMVHSLLFDRLGFTGVVGNVVRLGGYGSDAIRSIGSDLNNESDQIEDSTPLDLFGSDKESPKGLWHLGVKVAENAKGIREQIKSMFYGDRDAWTQFWQSGDQNLNVPEFLLPKSSQK